MPLNKALLALTVCLFGSFGIANRLGVLERQPLSMCRQIVTTPDGRVEMGLNIAPRNHREAALSIGLALFVILELTIFIGVLNNTAMDLLVKPVAAILHVIRTQAGKVMAALDKDDVSHCSPLFCNHPGLMIYQGPSCTSFRRRPGMAVMQRISTSSHVVQTHHLDGGSPGNALLSTDCLSPSRRKWAKGRLLLRSYGASCGLKHDVMLRRGGTTMSWG